MEAAESFRTMVPTRLYGLINRKTVISNPMGHTILSSPSYCFSIAANCTPPKQQPATVSILLQRETYSNNVIIALVCTVQLGSILLVFFYLPGRLILVDSFLHVPFRVVVFHLLLPLSHYFTCWGHYRASLTILYNSKTGWHLATCAFRKRTSVLSSLFNNNKVIWSQSPETKLVRPYTNNAWSQDSLRRYLNGIP